MRLECGQANFSDVPSQAIILTAGTLSGLCRVNRVAADLRLVGLVKRSLRK